MKKMIEAIGKMLYGWIVWIGCLTVGESWEDVRREMRELND